MPIKTIQIRGEFITLGQLLKIADLVSTGGETKIFLISNQILINNELDNRRGRKLYKGDLIEINHQIYKIC